MALPAESVTVDVHCVTRWFKLDTVWRGVSLDTLLADIETEADFALVHSCQGAFRASSRATPHQHSCRRTRTRPLSMAVVSPAAACV
jgi:DMSO/TMAO reductase YedYZ molybdopterin-dependent catalytic subunit